MSTTRKSVALSTVSRFGSIATSLALVVFVARWLYPTEIGAFAVAYATFTLFDQVRLAQIPAFVIQAPNVDKSLMRSVQLVGWAIALTVLVMSAGVAALLVTAFDQPEVGYLLALMIPAYFISTLIQPAFGIINRQMRFGVVAGVEVSGALTKAAVTISALLAGFRAEALAFGVVAEIAVKLAYLSKVDPRLALARPSRGRVPEVWAFCTRFTGAELINRTSMALIEILIGSFLGLAAAGFYNRSAVLVRKLRSGIESAIVPVALAAFAKSNRENVDLARRDYLTGISLLTGITWPGLAVFIVLAKPIILTFYGERWEETIYLAQILSAGAIIHGVTAMAPALLASMGRVHSLLLRNLASAVPRLLILLATLQYDLPTVLWGLFASMLIHFAINQTLLWREARIGPSDLLKTLWRSSLLAVTSSAAPYFVLSIPAVSEQSSLMHLAWCVPVAGSAWLITLMLIGHPLKAEIMGALKRIRFVRAAHD
ncbi:MAG: oligosaccharide flippase family protein [Erythrobacter sp.]|uniref:oligosaccharide flippase family protein n=1 Tax=Erythrobacter sp. TaxID=1042 RepID=UPI0032EEEC31